MLPFSNPRLKAEFNDWPSGQYRVQCKFEIEQNKKGERCNRTTTNKTGQWCKPKTNTYAQRMCIVDGSDGKTYLLCQSHYGIHVMTHDFMSAKHPDTPHAFSVSPNMGTDKDKEFYKDFLALMDAAHKV